jgi:hypothetical protein
MTLRLNSLKIEELIPFEGQGPANFCNTGLVTSGQSHCAHFVCHALDFKMAKPLCGDLQLETRGKGVTMRVDDVFNYCTVTGFYEDPAKIPDAVVAKSAFLVVATRPDNIEDRGGTIFVGNNPHKHIGICASGDIWNFSNTRHKVVRDTAANFFKKMKHSYGSNTRFLYAYRQDM